jgi:uncharacterized protein YndB with AHSA1/START domain
MANSATLTITTPGERDIAFTRVFNAPRALVWEALTRPELLKQWFGRHRGWALAVCDIDLRVGGAYRYVWRRGTAEMGVSGVFREVVQPERLVATEHFDESWYPGEAITTQMLVERAGQTTLTLTVTYESREARDGVLNSPAADGVAASYDLLAELLITRT